MPRDYRLALEDIIQHAALIVDALGNIDFTSFAKDRHKQAAIERYLEIIGEAVKNLPGDLKARHKGDWRLAASMRNILAHEYYAVVAKIIWDTATEDEPRLAMLAKRILDGSI